jgi:hypothetical protein
MDSVQYNQYNNWHLLYKSCINGHCPTYSIIMCTSYISIEVMDTVEHKYRNNELVILKIEYEISG